jgi:hypothetical protein
VGIAAAPALEATSSFRLIWMFPQTNKIAERRILRHFLAKRRKRHEAVIAPLPLA